MRRHLLIGMGFQKRLLHRNRYMPHFVASQMGSGAMVVRPAVQRPPARIMGEGAMKQEGGSFIVPKSARISPLKFKF